MSIVDNVKYLIIICNIFFFLACNIYFDNITVTLSGLNRGVLILTSKDSSVTRFISEETNLEIEVRKGETLSATFYPYIGPYLSRYPYGAIIDGKTRTITLSPHNGIITKSMDNILKTGQTIDLLRVNLLIDFVKTMDNPWRIDFMDLENYLTGKISFNSIDLKKNLVIPDLDKYFNWVCEDVLFTNWYSSVFLFYNIKERCFYRIQVFEDGTYNGFYEFN